MGFFRKLLGTSGDDDELVDEASSESAIGLLLVFAETFDLDPAAVTETLREYSQETEEGTFEIAEDFSEQGTPLGLIGWGEHVVRLVGFDQPAPSEIVEMCVAPAHYDAATKQAVRAHQAHLLLYYAGRESSPHEQYVALAAVAGVLADHGALAVLNEAARTSLPAAVLARGFALESEMDPLEQLRTLPLPMLYVGMVKYDLEDGDGVWMRTYGAPLLGLADFAHLAASHAEGTQTFEFFANMMAYQLSSGAAFGDGHSAQIGEDTFMTLRVPTEEEAFLQHDEDGGAELYIVELVSADAIDAS